MSCYFALIYTFSRAFSGPDTSAHPASELRDHTDGWGCSHASRQWEVALPDSY